MPNPGVFKGVYYAKVQAAFAGVSSKKKHEAVFWLVIVGAIDVAGLFFVWDGWLLTMLTVIVGFMVAYNVIELTYYQYVKRRTQEASWTYGLDVTPDLGCLNGDSGAPSFGGGSGGGGGSSHSFAAAYVETNNVLAPLDLQAPGSALLGSDSGGTDALGSVVGEVASAVGNVFHDATVGMVAASGETVAQGLAGAVVEVVSSVADAVSDATVDAVTEVAGEIVSNIISGIGS